MAYKLLIDLLHSLPRFTFTLHRVRQSFTLQLKSDYVQSLLVFTAIASLIGGALLLTIITTWICQCCGKSNANAKSRRRVHQLSLILFIISILCFLCLGICLFGNEHLNRGVTSSIEATNDVAKNMMLAEAQCNSLNGSRLSISKNMDGLSTLIRNEEKKVAALNKTLLHQIESEIDSFQQTLDEVELDLELIQSLLASRNFIDRSTHYAQRIELERWILCATLLSIMLIVLFAGVISFCRQSKKGAIVFSGLGFAIFIVGWLLLTTIFPINIALADFCADGGAFIHDHMSTKSIQVFEYYASCDPSVGHHNVPDSFELDKLSSRLSNAQEIEAKLTPQINALFNESKGTSEFVEHIKLINKDVIFCLKSVGGLEATIACNAYHSDVVDMNKGICVDGIIGSSILFYCLILLETFLFALLLIVSKSWQLFARLSSDYIEVDEEDPFFPRGNESTIPVDIYGTHVYNPRTRFASSLDRTEQSTGTTTVTSGLANGSATNHTSASAVLLNSNDDASTPLWHRGLAGSTATSTVNAPPAVGTNSIARTVYPTVNDEAAYRYRNYHEQFDV